MIYPFPESVLNNSTYYSLYKCKLLLTLYSGEKRY